MNIALTYFTIWNLFFRMNQRYKNKKSLRYYKDYKKIFIEYLLFKSNKCYKFIKGLFLVII